MSRHALLIPTLMGLLLTLPAAASEWKTVALHPLIAELAREVGGDRVEVVALAGINADPHEFEPTPEELAKTEGARVYLVSGKGLESYLPTLRSIVEPAAEVIEVGASLPSIESNCVACHPDDSHAHVIDPHWWHSVDAFRRATSEVARYFSEIDPAGAAEFHANALAYRGKLDTLESWVRRQVARVPAERRVLATSHAAFGYFCAEFGFEAIPVQGLNREQMPDPKSLARLIATLRERKVQVIFPEDISNPRTLQAITRDTGIRLGDPLIADGSTADSYEAMVRHNVGTICKALR